VWGQLAMAVAMAAGCSGANREFLPGLGGSGGGSSGGVESGGGAAGGKLGSSGGGAAGAGAGMPGAAGSEAGGAEAGMPGELGAGAGGDAPVGSNAVCGDGALQSPEECNDGDAKAPDGCVNCKRVAGWTCTGSPSSCTPICGDGLKVGNEACDDGNSDNSDACTSACRCGPGRGGADCEPLFEEITPSDRNGVATAVSRDGSRVAGNWGSNGSFRWARATGVTPIALPGTSAVEFSFVYGMNADASVVVGTYLSTPDPGTREIHRAATWTSAGMALLTTTDPDTVPPDSHFSDVSATATNVDGTVIVGHFSPLPNARQAFKWSPASNMVELAASPSDAVALSADGSVAVGSTGDPPIAVRWRLSGASAQALTIPSGYTQSVAEAVSVDGGVIYGTLTSETGDAAFRTTSDGQTALLSGTAVSTTRVVGCSADGKIAVGVDTRGSTWIWDQAAGKLVWLGAVLSSAGVNLNGALLTAHAVSANGDVIVGSSSRDGGDTSRAFIAHWR